MHEIPTGKPYILAKFSKGFDRKGVYATRVPMIINGCDGNQCEVEHLVPVMIKNKYEKEFLRRCGRFLASEGALL